MVHIVQQQLLCDTAGQSEPYQVDFVRCFVVLLFVGMENFLLDIQLNARHATNEVGIRTLSVAMVLACFQLVIIQ
jgi:hypothetical protein